MSENTNKVCGTCKHWGSPKEVAAGYDWRACQAIKHDKDGNSADYKMELKEYEGQNDEYEREMYGEYLESLENLKPFKAVACDGSGFYAALKTFDSFFCCLYESEQT